MPRSVHEFAFGMRMALLGADARLRLALTAAGVAFGVALLLIAASVPHMVAAHESRAATLEPIEGQVGGSLRLLSTDTTFRGQAITGFTLQVVGSRPPIPPGVARLPAAGEIVVSPALAAVLRGPGGGELLRRLDARVVGTIGDRGVTEPSELRFYRGGDALGGLPGSLFVLGFGDRARTVTSPVITLLVIVMLVALLLPVAAFVSTASRFGSDARDARLAAMRLLGADRGATARIAAGESLLGALIGVVGGVGLFLAIRPLAPQIDVAGISVFAADVQPSAALAVLVVVLVPMTAIVSALATMRRVLVEPLAVSRRARTARRRLAWRLGVPLAGFAVLAPFIEDRSRLGTTAGEIQASAGVLLALVGLTAILPWLLERVVGRAPDGPTPWLLAVRRLRSTDSTGGRVIGAIMLAVAGAIALQMVFGAAAAQTSAVPGLDEARDVLLVSAHVTAVDGAIAEAGTLRVRGVSDVIAVAQRTTPDGDTITVAPCPVLRELATIARCDGSSAFVLAGSGLRPGAVLRLGPHRLWRIPASAPTVQPGAGQLVFAPGSVLLAPSVARPSLRTTSLLAAVRLRPGDRAAADLVSDAAARLDPFADVTSLTSAISGARQLDSLRRVLLTGAVVVLLAIGASLVVAVAEQLRERRRVLAELAAVGVPRATLAWSLALQSALPVLLGLALAIVIGCGLGSLLTTIIRLPVSYDWGAIGVLAGGGVVVIGLVTSLTLPLLWQLTKPIELRTE
jgi:hypothetical protein